MLRRFPAHVYYHRLALARNRLIQLRGFWTDELTALDLLWWEWCARNSFPNPNPTFPRGSNNK